MRGDRTEVAMDSQRDCTMRKMLFIKIDTRTLCRILWVLFGSLVAGVAIAQEPHSPDTRGLPKELLSVRLHTLAAQHHGQVALFAVQLNTGNTVGLNPDAVVQTASVIKLAILYEAMQQVRSGAAKWDDAITLRQGDAVSGSGILLFFDTPHRLTLREDLTLMVMMSDNTATNLAIDRLGLDSINQRIAWMGLQDTHLYKKIGKPADGPMPSDQPKFGLGKTTPREMAMLMERIGRCEFDQLPLPTLGARRRCYLRGCNEDAAQPVLPRHRTPSAGETGFYRGRVRHRQQDGEPERGAE